jgi:hypothetical protein
MKSFLDFAESGEALRTLASQTGWSATRLGAMARDAQHRLRERAPAEPGRPWNFEQQVPEALSTRPPKPMPSVEMQLASGRRVRVRMSEVAARGDLEAVARTADQNAHRHSATLTQHARALDALRREDLDLDRRLKAVQAQADLALLAALRGSSGLLEKLSETVQRVEAQEQTSRALQDRVKFQGQLARTDRVRAAVSTMQGAAYGERGNVFATNNLLLGGSELLWGSIDTILRRFGLWSDPSPVPLTWVGPLIGLVVGHFTVGQQQFERFISGQLTLEPLSDDDADVRRFGYTGAVDLRPHVAPGYWDEFRKKPAVPATAQVVDAGAFGIAIAWVEFGTLQILALSAPAKAQLEITWTVDVEASGG